jgi:hypothetical protein
VIDTGWGRVSNPPKPLKRYGILRAAVVDRRIGTIDTPHCQIRLRAAGTDYRAAVDVRSQQSPPDRLHLGLDHFEHPILERARRLLGGFAEIGSRAGGAAIDYIGKPFRPSADASAADRHTGRETISAIFSIIFPARAGWPRLPDPDRRPVQAASASRTKTDPPEGFGSCRTSPWLA